MFRKIKISLILIGLLFFPIHTAKSSITLSDINLLLLDRVTATGDGAFKSIGFLTSKFICHVRTGGTAPTSVIVAIKGSADGLTYGTFATHTYTVADSTTATFSISNSPARFLKGNYTSKVGGDGTTSVTISCGCGGD